MKAIKFLTFFLFYLKEVIKTNFIVAMEVVTPTHYMKSGFIELDVNDLDDSQLLIFCNLLTMTPGSMVVDVSEDKKTVLVHILYLEDEEVVKSEIQEQYLNKVRELF